MKREVAKFTFTVPENSPVEAERGQKQEKPFEFVVAETLEEAAKILEEKKWNLVSLVNDNLKANARANAYQAALAPHRPSEVSPEDIKERMIRDFIRLGVSEDMARKQVDALLAAQTATA